MATRTGAAALAVLAVGMGWLTASAQQPVPGVAPPNVILALKTAKEFSKERIKETVETALRLLANDRNLDPASASGKPTVDTIPAEEYRVYQRLAGLKPDPEAAAKIAAGKKITASLQVGSPPTWQLRLASDSGRAILPKLKVRFSDDTEESYGPPALDTAGVKAPFATLQAGVYLFRPPVGKQPTKFTATLKRVVDGKETDETEDGDFASEFNHYLVSVPDFRLDLANFQKILQDSGRLVGNAVTLDEGRDLRLLVGRLGVKGGAAEEDSLDQNKLVLYQPPLKDPKQREKTARVWVLFPLTDAQAAKQLEKLNNETPQSILKRIKESEGDPEIGRAPIVVGRSGSEDMILTPQTKPRWIELSKAPATQGEGYARTVYLMNRDSNAVKPADYASLFASFPRVNKIVVYELDNMEPGAARVVSAAPYTSPRDPSGSPKLAQSSELTLWAQGLRQLTGSGTAATPPKTPSAPPPK